MASAGVIILGIVSPLPQRGLDEALSVAVGARGIGPGEDVFEPELLAGPGKTGGRWARAHDKHTILDRFGMSWTFSHFGLFRYQSYASHCVSTVVRVRRIELRLLFTSRLIL